MAALSLHLINNYLRPHKREQIIAAFCLIFVNIFSVAIPMAKNGFISASVLGFAHTIGEFGVVLMIGGNIPGETRVLSISIYDHVEMLAYDSAHLLSKMLLFFSFVLLISVYSLNRHFSIIKGK